MANNKDIKNATLIGKAYYVFNRKPHHDKDNDKDLYKLDLVLTNPDGTPIIRKNKKTGEEVNMVQRAEELGLILKEPRGTIEGTHVKIKREVRKLKDGSYTLPPETKDPRPRTGSPLPRGKGSALPSRGTALRGGEAAPEGGSGRARRGRCPPPQAPGCPPCTRWNATLRG